MKKICEKCGHINEGKNKFCSKCGSPLGDNEVKRDYFKPIIIGVLSLFIIILIVVIFINYMPSKKMSGENKSSQASGEKNLGDKGTEFLKEGKVEEALIAYEKDFKNVDLAKIEKGDILINYNNYLDISKKLYKIENLKKFYDEIKSLETPLANRREEIRIFIDAYSGKTEEKGEENVNEAPQKAVINIYQRGNLIYTLNDPIIKNGQVMYPVSEIIKAVNYPDDYNTEGLGSAFYESNQNAFIFSPYDYYEWMYWIDKKYIEYAHEPLGVIRHKYDPIYENGELYLDLELLCYCLNLSFNIDGNNVNLTVNDMDSGYSNLDNGNSMYPNIRFIKYPDINLDLSGLEKYVRSKW